jgi:hypothetical protein
MISAFIVVVLQLRAPLPVPILLTTGPAAMTITCARCVLGNRMPSLGTVGGERLKRETNKRF